MTTNNTTPATIDIDNLSTEQLREIVLQKTQENARLKNVQKGGKGGITMKVSDKGCISAYGLGSFPVSLYEPAWLKLIEHIEEVKAYVMRARAEGLLPNDEQVAAGKAAAKVLREERAAAKKAAAEV